MLIVTTHPGRDFGRASKNLSEPRGHPLQYGRLQRTTRFGKGKLGVRENYECGKTMQVD